jgi:hypothetical protein
MAKPPFVRYTFQLPKEIHQELAATAAADGVSIRDLLLRMVRLGLYIAHETENVPDAQLVIRAESGDKVLVPLLT